MSRKTYLQSLRDTEQSLLAGLVSPNLHPHARAEIEIGLTAVRDAIERETHSLKVAMKAAADDAIAAGERVEIFAEEHEPKEETSE